MKRKMIRRCWAGGLLAAAVFLQGCGGINPETETIGTKQEAASTEWETVSTERETENRETVGESSAASEMFRGIDPEKEYRILVTTPISSYSPVEITEEQSRKITELCAGLKWEKTEERNPLDGQWAASALSVKFLEEGGGCQSLTVTENQMFLTGDAETFFRIIEGRFPYEELKQAMEEGWKKNK